MSGTGSFAALAVPDYRRFWFSGVLSNTGTAMQAVAMDWYVLQISGSGTAVGWAVGLQFAPVLLFGLWGGVISDRLDRRRLLLIAQSLYAVQSIILAAAVLSGHASLSLLFVLSFSLGLVFMVENPARLSFVTDLVGPQLIPNAAGLNILSLNVARLVGAALAGLLLTWFGAGWVFAINSLSFIIMITALATIHPITTERVILPWRGAGIDGLRYVAGRKDLVAVFLVYGLTATFGMNFPTTLTLFAGREFDTGSTGLGVMSAALAIGTIIGTLFAARRDKPRITMVTSGAFWFGVSLAVLAVAPTYPTFLVVLLVSGFILMLLAAAVSAYVQTGVDNAVRGRVMAVYTVISMGGTPIGSPIVGWVSDRFGVRWGVALGAAVCVSIALIVSIAVRRAKTAWATPTDRGGWLENARGKESRCLTS